MLVRNILLALGALFVLAGLALAVVWLQQVGTSSDGPVAEAAPPPSLSVLSATRELPSGTLLRPTDIVWKDIQPGELRPGNIVRGQSEEGAMLGAVTRRDFATGDALVASELVTPGDRRFLAAVLKPGLRAATIGVDESQISSGLILPGDRVDVILTQNFDTGIAQTQHKSVGETVLRDLRVVAVGSSLGGEAKPESTETAAPVVESKVPKTVTLELSEKEAERLFVAEQIGGIQLTVRPLESGAVLSLVADSGARPTWASDVSPALSELNKPKSTLPTASAIAPLPSPAPAPVVAAPEEPEPDLSMYKSSIENSIRVPPRWKRPANMK